MSGGHFDYQDNRIDDMMDIIKHDIKYNDVDWSYTSETGEPVVDYGFQLFIVMTPPLNLSDASVIVEKRLLH